MQWIKKLFIVMSAWVLCSLAAADPASDTLMHLLNNIRSMQADFTETISGQSAQPMQQSEGHMVLSRPGKFRWQVIKPVAQLLVANGKKLWIYDPDLEQVTIRPLTKAAGEAPALLLSDANVRLTKDFTVQRQNNNDLSLQWFSLTPKNSESMLSHILLGFSGNEIREMDLRDHLGHTTRIRFQHIVLNVTPSAALFTFDPPVNVDVIDETRR